MEIGDLQQSVQFSPRLVVQMILQFQARPLFAQADFAGLFFF